MYIKGLRILVRRAGAIEDETLQMLIQRNGQDVWVDVPRKIEGMSNELHSADYLTDTEKDVFF